MMNIKWYVLYVNTGQEHAVDIVVMMLLCRSKTN